MKINREQGERGPKMSEGGTDTAHTIKFSTSRWASQNQKLGTTVHTSSYLFSNSYISKKPL